MIGVLDSGSGGVSAVLYLRRLLPTADVAFFADTENAPYGNKSAEELIPLIERGIDVLVGMGASQVLMACCTASTLWSKLPRNKRDVSLPIISPTVRELSRDSKRITVISTDFTASSHVFSEMIKKRNPRASVTEIPMQELVLAIESCRGRRYYSHFDEDISLPCADVVRDPAVSRGLAELEGYISALRPDTLILGCTHFAWIENEVARRFPSLKILNPARIGAEALADRITKSGAPSGNGRTVYV